MAKPPLAPAVSDRFGFLLGLAHGGLRLRAVDTVGELGLDVKEYGVLTALRGMGSAPSQQELADRMRMDRTTMVSILDSLEDAGHVRRSVDPTDRRRHLLEVTAKGRRVQERADRMVDEAEDDFLAPLSASERSELRRMLQRLAAASGAAPRAPLPPRKER